MTQSNILKVPRKLRLHCNRGHLKHRQIWIFAPCPIMGSYWKTNFFFFFYYIGRRPEGAIPIRLSIFGKSCHVTNQVSNSIDLRVKINLPHSDEPAQKKMRREGTSDARQIIRVKNEKTKKYCAFTKQTHARACLRDPGGRGLANVMSADVIFA